MTIKSKAKAGLTKAVIAMAMVGIIANSAIASVLYEGFDYTPADGTLAINGLNGGTGFDGGWYNCYTGTNPDKIVAGETFGALPVSGGALQRTDRSGSDATARKISSAAQAALTQDNTTMWFSVLMKANNGGNGFAVNSYATLILGDAGLAGGATNATVGAPAINGTGNAIGVGFCATVNGTGNYSDMRIQGVTYKDGVSSMIRPDRIVVGDSLVMVVGKVDWSANGTNDVLSLYNISDPAAELPTAFTTMEVDLNQSTFNILSIGDAQTSLFDEIRFGATYEEVVPIGWTKPTVDAGVDMITWSGEPVQLVPMVVNNQPDIDLTYVWSADPIDGVEFSATDVQAPTVTITKTTDNPSVFTLTLSVNNVGELPEQAVEDTMTIDLYEDGCRAAKAVDPELLDPSDLNGDCIVDVQDLILLAQTWLDDYMPTEPLAK